MDDLLDDPLRDENKRFSFRTLWAFTGPGFLMSIAFLDPGNIESDLQSGATSQYKLLWVLLWAHIVGLLLQRMSARLGVVTGKDMAEIAHSYYPVVPRIFIWIMIEIAIICADMQEVIGTAIALHILTATHLPLWAGVVITILDTFTFLTIERCGFRKLEFFFAILIAIMAVTFGVEFFIVKPSELQILKGALIPWCEGCGREQLLQGVSLVGAIIMPHNLFLHSSLVKTRKLDRSKKWKVSQANMYYFVECSIAIFVSFLINLFVVSVFAHGLYGKTNWEVRESCLNAHGIPDPDAFPANNETAYADIYKGGIFLGCEFGLIAMYIWAVGILAAGQSSTMTGTYAGQCVMEGFIKVNWPQWRRVLFTRSFAIIPTLTLTLVSGGVTGLTAMNDILNCVQMIQLPFALLPAITFTSSDRIMHEFRNSWPFRIFAFSTTFLFIAINIFFAQDTIISRLGSDWYIITPLIIVLIIYVGVILYLTILCLMAMDIFPRRLHVGFSMKDALELDAPWDDSLLGNEEDNGDDYLGRIVF